MVFILHPKQHQLSKSLKRNNIMYKLQSEEAQQPEPDPIMTRIQQDTKIEDLSSGGESKMTGSGFKVVGGNVRNSKNPQNEKLRKFVSLKIK